MQLILGAAFRHSGIKLLPHLMGACVVTAMFCWTVVRVLTRYGSVHQLRRPAQLLLALLMVQLGLGFFAYLTRVQWGHDALYSPCKSWSSAPSPTLRAAHWSWRTTVVLAMQTRRMIRAHVPQSVSTRRTEGRDRMSTATQPLAVPRAGLAAWLATMPS